MKNEIIEISIKKIWLSFILGFAASYLGSVAAYYYNILPQKTGNNIEEKVREKVLNVLERITIPSNILFYEEIKECIDEPGPIKDGSYPGRDKILNVKKILRKSIKIEKKTLLRIEAIAGSAVDRMKLSDCKAETLKGNHSYHHHKAIGFMDTRIFIDGIERNGESKPAVHRLQPGIYSSCPFSIILEPDTYKIQVEVIYYGYLTNAKAIVKLIGERAEPVNIKELIEEELERQKSRLYLGIEVKDKNQTFDKNIPGGIQPSIAGPAVKCSHEVQTGEKPGASDGVRYPEAVKGQR